MCIIKHAYTVTSIHTAMPTHDADMQVTNMCFFIHRKSLDCSIWRVVNAFNSMNERVYLQGENSVLATVDTENMRYTFSVMLTRLWVIVSSDHYLISKIGNCMYRQD